MSNVRTRLKNLGLRVTMSPGDAEALRWFFGFEPDSGYGASTLAACLERLELSGTQAKPCERCGGEDADDPNEAHGGSGFLENPASRAQTRGISGVPPAADMICSTCAGRGWILTRSTMHAHGALTVRPTRAHVRIVVREISTSDIRVVRWLGQMTGRLDKVGARSALALDVLATYYGPRGGTFGALWAMTDAGRAMLENNPFRLSPAELFANERAAERRSSKPERARLFREANDSAEDLLAIAAALWNETAEDEAPEPLRPAA
jgi:hypothetical protein